MGRIQELQEKQAIAAKYFASGMAVVDIADELQVSRRTLCRWRSRPDFQAEVERLAELLAPPTAALEQIESQEWAQDVETHLEFLKQAARHARLGGLNATNKALRRLRDLPDESLKPSDAIALLRAGVEMMRLSSDLSAEALGLYALAERVKDEK